jgi:hypothetical protein
MDFNRLTHTSQEAMQQAQSRRYVAALAQPLDPKHEIDGTIRRSHEGGCFQHQNL